MKAMLPAEIHLGDGGSIILRNAGTPLPDYMTFRFSGNDICFRVFKQTCFVSAVIELVVSC
jgi:hypothetical protein